MRQRKSWDIAFCGVSVALSVAFMLLGAAVPIAMFIAPAAAGILMAVLREECGLRMAVTAYGAVSLLGLLFVPDKEIPLIFAVLLGYYPLVKARFDAVHPAFLRAAAKLALCNGAVLAMYGFLFLLFPAEEMSGPAVWGALILSGITLAIGNVAFLLYDKALVKLMRAYKLLWQPRLHRMLGRR